MRNNKCRLHSACRVIVIVGCGALACTPDRVQAPSTLSNLTSTNTALAAERVAARYRDGEAVLHEMAGRMPHFAGIYYSGDNELTVVLKRGLPQEGAADHARAVLLRSGRRPRGSAWAIRITQAQYSFLELASWRDAVSDGLQAIAGWRSLDLNEKENRIDVGVADSEAANEVAELMLRSGVPADAFQTAFRERPQVNASLESRMRPLRGGIVIGPSGCTLHSIAKWGADFVVLINSHCSQTKWGVDAAWATLNQPLGSGFPSWGFEIWDTDGYVCGVLNRDDCRRADLSVYAATPDVGPGETALAFGELARPANRRDGSLNIGGGNHQLDAVNGPLKIVGTLEGLIMGETVDKIGVETGWTFGAVTATCENYQMDDPPGFGIRLYVCQGRADYNSDNGDSGAPVFVYHGGDNVSIAGINWGNLGDVTAVFAPTTQMRSELNQRTLSFFNPSLYYSPYSATIYGPDTAQPGDQCTWYVDSNVPNASVEWRVNNVLVGAGPTLTYSPSAPMALEAFVWNSSAASSATATKTVEVSSSSPHCLAQ